MNPLDLVTLCAIVIPIYAQFDAVLFGLRVHSYYFGDQPAKTLLDFF